MNNVEQTLPPHSISAEQAVLGGLMLDNDRWDDIATIISADRFYSRPHGVIFAAMQTLLLQNKPIDLITLAESMEQQGMLEQCGGFAYLRGNIYAQHDEPLGLFDAEYFDPGWLDAVADACRHTNKTIRLTALAVLHEIKSDTRMRHRHSRVALIDARLSAVQTPQEMVPSRQKSNPGSETEPGQKLQGSESELSRKSRDGGLVRK